MKAGDKVIVYNAEIRHFHMGSEWGPYQATVLATDVTWGTIPGYVRVKDSRGKERMAHPKQCEALPP